MNNLLIQRPVSNKKHAAHHITRKQLIEEKEFETWLNIGSFIRPEGLGVFGESTGLLKKVGEWPDKTTFSRNEVSIMFMPKEYIRKWPNIHFETEYVDVAVYVG